VIQLGTHTRAKRKVAEMSVVISKQQAAAKKKPEVKAKAGKAGAKPVKKAAPAAAKKEQAKK